VISTVRAIPPGADVLLDANVLVYALSAISPECVDLLRRCDTEDIAGFTTVEVISEVCHRLMIAEAFGKGLIGRPGMSALKGKNDLIRGLTDYWTQTQRLLDSNLLIIELTESRLRRAQQLRHAHGLLTTDATILAGAFELGIHRVATNDQDFATIPQVIAHRPSDVP